MFTGCCTSKSIGNFRLKWSRESFTGICDNPDVLLLVLLLLSLLIPIFYQLFYRYHTHIKFQFLSLCCYWLCYWFCYCDHINFLIFIYYFLPIPPLILLQKEYFISVFIASLLLIPPFLSCVCPIDILIMRLLLITILILLFYLS